LPHLLSKPAWDHKIPELIGDVKAMMSLFLKYKGVLPSRTFGHKQEEEAGKFKKLLAEGHPYSGFVI